MQTIGLMSGTSMDGVDGVLVHWHDAQPTKFTVRAQASADLPEPLRQDLLALNQRYGKDELHRSAVAANALSRLYAEVVQALLSAASVKPGEVQAIGAHGQTLRHQPGLHDGVGYTLQTLNGALLAELTQIDVVCDFRSRDVAAGGQGAPLAPLFHQHVFQRPGKAAALLNWGGIANLTVLAADPSVPVIGFDCGPANVLLDAWCHKHRGTRMDVDGAWARTGRVNRPLLQHLLDSEPYFLQPIPKSTGRDLFDLGWLESRLTSFASAHLPPADVQTSLIELTACTSAAAIGQHAAQVDAVHVCGGGALNPVLMARLQAQLVAVGLRALAPQVASTAAIGLPPLQVEAAAFAWFAAMHQLRQKLPTQSITGAHGARVLGCCYPA